MEASGADNTEKRIYLPWVLDSLVYHRLLDAAFLSGPYLDLRFHRRRNAMPRPASNRRRD